MFSLSEAENRIQNLRSSRLLLKFYNWYFSGGLFTKFFDKLSHTNDDISKNRDIFLQFSSADKFLKSISTERHAKFDFDR